VTADSGFELWVCGRSLVSAPVMEFIRTVFESSLVLLLVAVLYEVLSRVELIGFVGHQLFQRCINLILCHIKCPV
jgi:hypothetical protein